MSYVPLVLRTEALPHGKTCNSCKRVRKTFSFSLIRDGDPIREIRLCEKCLLEEIVEADVHVDAGPDPEKSRNSKRRIKQSQKLERELAKKMGGRRQPGSGNTRLSGYKGDIRKLGSWRVEHKFTDSLANYSLKLVDLARITSIAMEANEMPALVLEFRKIGERFAILPLSLFLEMINEDTDDQRPRRRR